MQQNKGADSCMVTVQVVFAFVFAYAKKQVFLAHTHRQKAMALVSISYYEVSPGVRTVLSL